MTPVSADEVRRARDGDPAALEMLARQALRSALRTSAAITHSRDDAADIAQDVAVEVLRSLPKLRAPKAFDAWVHRITVRHALRVLRRRRARSTAETPLALLTERDEPATSEGVDRATLLSTRAVIAAALEQLPPKQRVALALRYVHDLPDTEIAAALGCRVGTAQALLSRGRAAMRRDPRVAELASLPTPGGSL